MFSEYEYKYYNMNEKESLRMLNLTTYNKLKVYDLFFLESKKPTEYEMLIIQNIISFY